MISTAFPKEAFKRPERVWPSFNDSCSVATPNSYNDRKHRSATETTRAKSGRGWGGVADLCEGHNSNKTEREPQGGIPIQVVREEAQGDKYEHNVQPRAEEEKPEGFDPTRLVFGDSEEANDALLVGESVYVTVRTMAVLEEGCRVCRGHVGWDDLAGRTGREGAWV